MLSRVAAVAARRVGCNAFTRTAAAGGHCSVRAMTAYGGPPPGCVPMSALSPEKMKEYHIDPKEIYGAENFPKAAPASSPEEEAALAKTLEEEKAAYDSLPSPFKFIADNGFNDWKLAVPLGIVVAIPVITNEWFVINEETQLAGCFAMFVGLSYTHGKDAVSGYFKEKSDAIIKEFNDAEEAVLVEAKTNAEFYKNHTGVSKIVELQHAFEIDLKRVMAENAAAQQKHATFAETTRLLQRYAGMEMQWETECKQKLVDAAVKKTLDAIQKDKKMKKAIMDDALAALEGKTSKQIIPELFITSFKASAQSVGKKGSELQPAIEAWDTKRKEFLSM